MTQSLTPNEQADCYCSCHQLTSSRPNCEHCNQTTSSVDIGSQDVNSSDSELRAAEPKLCNCDGEWHVEMDGLTRYVDVTDVVTAERTAIKALLPKKDHLPDGVTPVEIAKRLDDFNRGRNSVIDQVTQVIDGREGV